MVFVNALVELIWFGCNWVGITAMLSNGSGLLADKLCVFFTDDTVLCCDKWQYLGNRILDAIKPCGVALTN